MYIRKDGEDDWSFEIKGVIPGTTISDYLPMEPWRANGMLGIEDENYNPFEKREQKSLRINTLSSLFIGLYSINFTAF